MIFKFTLKSIVIPLLAGAVFSLAFAPYYQLFWAPICLSLLFMRINRATSKIRAFGNAFAFGFGFGAVSTGWLAHAIMLEGPSAWPLVLLAWAGMGLLFGLFWGIPSALALFYRAGIRRLWAWAALMTIFEWIRSWFLTGFPWNLTGSVWENFLPVLQSASIFGVYGLGFITLICMAAPALWPNRKPLYAAAAILIVLTLWGAGRLYTATNDTVWGIRLRLVQPNIPQTLKWDPKEADASFAKLRRLSRENNDTITHVLWPESAVSFLVNEDTDNRLLMMQAVRQGGFLITGGMRLTPDNRVTNSLFVLDDLANIVTYYDKSHLVPFGEYVPLRGLIPWDKVVPFDFDLSPGEGVQTLRAAHTPALGPLVCYEVIFSGHVTDKHNRPAWLVNVTNDGWYGDSAGPYQHLGMARMRAVEEGLPLARIANTGISAVFDGYGRMTDHLPLNTEGVLVTALPTALPPTPYARTGVWGPMVFCALLLIFLRRRRNNA